MSPELKDLIDQIERWDPEREDLPDAVALAMDAHPELRDAFDARFPATAVRGEPLPEGLVARVWPRYGRPRRVTWRPLAAAAVGLLVSALAVRTLQPGDGSLLTLEESASPSDAGAEERPAGPLASGDEVRVVHLRFEPDLPPTPRRLPVRPSRHALPAPYSPPLAFVEALRRRDCAAVMDAVAEASEGGEHRTSPLWRSAWLCFHDAHQRGLERAESRTWAEFASLLEHFEGTPEAMAEATRGDPSRSRQPRWYRAPVGGLEYRLRRFGEDGSMVDALHDLFGEPTIADHLARDVHLEALAAWALSRVPPEDRTPELIDAWARRVYVTAEALEGPPGRSLYAHRPELVPELRRLLDDATSVPAGTNWRVPAEVTRARAVGEGHAPPPGGP